MPYSTPWASRCGAASWSCCARARRRWADSRNGCRLGAQAVSKHLRVLTNAGLIEHRSAGTRNLYAMAPDGMAAAQQWLVRTWQVMMTGRVGYR